VLDVANIIIDRMDSGLEYFLFLSRLDSPRNCALLRRLKISNMRELADLVAAALNHHGESAATLAREFEHFGRLVRALPAIPSSPRDKMKLRKSNLDGNVAASTREAPNSKPKISRASRKKLKNVAPELLRMVSVPSQHAAAQACTVHKLSIERAIKGLRIVSEARKSRIITQNEKAELKLKLIREGYGAMLRMLKEFPGAQRLVATETANVRRSLRNNKPLIGQRKHVRDSDSKVFLLRSFYLVKCKLKELMVFTSVFESRGSAAVLRTVLDPPQVHRENMKRTLHPSSQRLLTEPNAGGNSENSEGLSFEILNCVLFPARDVKGELEIEYKCRTSIADYLCTIFNEVVGVSVTRAMKYPNPEAFTADDAKRLLRKKIRGIIKARRNVKSAFQWSRSILHVWAQTEDIASIVCSVYRDIASSADSATAECNIPRECFPSLVVTTSHQIYRYIFFNAPSIAAERHDVLRPQRDAARLRNKELSLIFEHEKT